MLGQGVDLPVVAELLARLGGRRALKVPRPTDAVTYPRLGELAIDACGGQVVDTDLGEVARRGQLLAQIELALVDRAPEALDELLGDRYLAAPSSPDKSALYDIVCLLVGHTLYVQGHTRKPRESRRSSR